MLSSDPTPTLEVRVHRHGRLVERVLCDTEEEAAAVALDREERPGTVCEVHDLSTATADGSERELGDLDESGDH